MFAKSLGLAALVAAGSLALPAAATTTITPVGVTATNTFPFWGTYNAENLIDGSGLSGGQARRLVLARAVLRRPDVLLLDEPTEGLDPATAGAMLAGLRAALPESGLLVVSHRSTDAAAATRSVSLPFPGPA